MTEESRLIIHDTQPELNNQRPTIQFLTRDKFGGENFQAVEVQSNRLSKRLLSSLWLENLLLSSNGLELLSKAIAWFAAGSGVALMVSHSWALALATVPIILFICWLLSETQKTHLAGSTIFLSLLFLFGLILAFIF
ncbi:hypothetical protein ACQ4N7_29235 [Nodosilinea sp. AN01ver1]|uniref:hypothetical protein n=1 Tax=Nodosilinea sp. AN01ver1 TaxID=3423362 RepID=UPI003D31EAEE